MCRRQSRYLGMNNETRNQAWRMFLLLIPTSPCHMLTTRVRLWTVSRAEPASPESKGMCSGGCGNGIEKFHIVWCNVLMTQICSRNICWMSSDNALSSRIRSGKVWLGIACPEKAKGQSANNEWNLCQVIHFAPKMLTAGSGGKGFPGLSFCKALCQQQWEVSRVRTT